MDNSNKKYKIADPTNSIVNDPIADYNLGEKKITNIEDHPLFAEVIEKGLRESELGLGISHEEMKLKIKLRYPFLK